MADENGNSEAQIGWGTGFFMEATPGGALTELDEVTEVPFAEDTADDVEVTHLKSPDRCKEFIRGLIDGGTGQLVLNYIVGSPTDVLIATARKDGLTRKVRVVLPDAAGDLYAVDAYAYVQSRSRSIPVNDRRQMTVTLRYTGTSDEGAVATDTGDIGVVP